MEIFFPALALLFVASVFYNVGRNNGFQKGKESMIDLISKDRRARRRRKRITVALSKMPPGN